MAKPIPFVAKRLDFISKAIGLKVSEGDKIKGEVLEMKDATLTGGEQIESLRRELADSQEKIKLRLRLELSEKLRQLPRGE